LIPPVPTQSLWIHRALWRECERVFQRKTYPLFAPIRKMRRIVQIPNNSEGSLDLQGRFVLKGMT